MPHRVRERPFFRNMNGAFATLRPHPTFHLRSLHHQLRAYGSHPLHLEMFSFQHQRCWGWAADQADGRARAGARYGGEAACSPTMTISEDKFLNVANGSRWKCFCAQVTNPSQIHSQIVSSKRGA
jgi:hypothetical protein